MLSNSDESFRTLVVHFFHRFFDTDTPSEESLPRTRMIQFLALLAVVTPMLMILMARGEEKVQIAISGFDASWLRAGLHFTFVCYAMAVMGLVMAVKWDCLFPDRRDYVILTSLPVSARRLFAAKATALAGILSLFAIATNAILIVLFAFIEPRASLGHLIATFGASLFAALFCTALQGVLINVLRPSAFMRISPTIQTIAIAVLTTLVLVMPLVAAGLRPLVLIDSPLLDYFPPVWFLGIYETLGSTGSPMPKAGEWAWIGLWTTALMAVFVILSYVVGYRRHSRKVLEGIEGNDLTPRWWTVAGEKGLQFLLLTDGFQRAVFDFIGKIAERSHRHRISAAFYSGIGLALALSSLFVIDRREAFPIQLSTPGILKAPAALSFLIIAGWRATFGMPYELAANWIFQMASTGNEPSFRKAIRKWLFVCRILPLYVLIACFELAWFDSRTAATHLSFDLITTAFLIEALFFDFRKIPFTCGFIQRKLQLAFMAVVYLFAFTTYTSWMGALKGWVSADPQHLRQFLAVSSIAFGIILIYRSVRRAERSKFSYDQQDRPLQQLDLT